MRNKIIISLIVLLSTYTSIAQTTNLAMLCPIKRYIGCKSPIEFCQRFQGDTINFFVPNSEEVFLESFKLIEPDTFWIKERPKKKIPEQHKHYKLVTNFRPVSGWGVNAHRQYTPGSVLEKCRFIIRGTHEEDVLYRGTFYYILLEDVATGKLIKWDYAKNENNGLLIFSSSIIRHLSLMKGLDFLIAENDTTFIPASCKDVTFSVLVKGKQFLVSVDSDFTSNGSTITSHNWNPMFFLKKDEEKITTNTSTLF